jgi:hypothetical protein
VAAHLVPTSPTRWQHNLVQNFPAKLQLIPEFQLPAFQHADFIGWDLNFTGTFKEISRAHFGIKEKGNSCITGDGKSINNKTGKN